MPAVAHRINLSLSNEIHNIVRSLAFEDNVTPTTKALELLKVGIEIQEDKLYADIAEKRIKELDDGNKTTFSHDEFWKKALAQ
jgi:predicted DNA-binding protein